MSKFAHAPLSHPALGPDPVSAGWRMRKTDYWFCEMELPLAGLATRIDDLDKSTQRPVLTLFTSRRGGRIALGARVSWVGEGWRTAMIFQDYAATLAAEPLARFTEKSVAAFFTSIDASVIYEALDRIAAQYPAASADTE